MSASNETILSHLNKEKKKLKICAVYSLTFAISILYNGHTFSETAKEKNIRGTKNDERI